MANRHAVLAGHLTAPDFLDPACVAAWEQLIDELERTDMQAVEAERTWLQIAAVLLLARLQLGLVSARVAPLTLRRVAALADRAERLSFAAWGHAAMAL